MEKRNKRIFLDYASSTPIAKEVQEAMREADFANPSALYEEGMKAKEKVEDARKRIAQILQCQSKEIIFTSGGTESNNMALLGLVTQKNPHIVTTSIEHPSILEVCDEARRRGGEVTILPVSEDGVVDVNDVISEIKENTVLVSVMYANNEIGTIQPISEIGRAIEKLREKNNSVYPYFHTDASQAAIYLPIDVTKTRVDLMTLDGIKMYGPRGTGILFVRSEVELKALNYGGGQERGVRSGTENVSGIIGMAVALELAEEMKEGESVRLTEIRDYAIEKILNTFPGASLNGSQEKRLPNNINVCFPGLDAEFAVVSLDVAGIAISYSSACRTLSENSSSYVIEALGKSECSSSSLRFTMGRETMKSDIDDLVSALQKVVKG